MTFMTIMHYTQQALQEAVLSSIDCYFSASYKTVRYCLHLVGLSIRYYKTSVYIVGNGRLLIRVINLFDLYGMDHWMYPKAMINA